jgi:hypothetical protein
VLDSSNVPSATQSPSGSWHMPTGWVDAGWGTCGLQAFQDALMQGLCSGLLPAHRGRRWRKGCGLSMGRGGQETAEGSLQASCDALMQVRCTGCAASICLGAGCCEGVCILHRGRAGARWKVGRHAAGLFPGLRGLVVRSARAQYRAC